MFLHGIKELEIRFLDMCECQLNIRRDFCLPRKPHPFLQGQTAQGMVTLTHINLTELPSLLLFLGENE